MSFKSSKIVIIFFIWIIFNVFSTEGTSCFECGPDTSLTPNHPNYWACTEKFPPVLVNCTKKLNCRHRNCAYCAVAFANETGVTSRKCIYEGALPVRARGNECYATMLTKQNRAWVKAIQCTCMTNICNEKPVDELLKDFPLTKTEEEFSKEFLHCYECGPDPSLYENHPERYACSEKFPPKLVDCKLKYDCTPDDLCPVYCLVSFTNQTGVTSRSCEKRRMSYSDITKCYKGDWNNDNQTDITSCYCNSTKCNEKSTDALLKELPVIPLKLRSSITCRECGPNLNLHEEHPNFTACTEEYPPHSVNCNERLRCIPDEFYDCRTKCTASYNSTTGITTRGCSNEGIYGDFCGFSLDMKVTTCSCITDNCTARSVKVLAKKFMFI